MTDHEHDHPHGSRAAESSDAPGGHDEHAGHDAHGAHDKHAGHTPEMFRDRFWLSLILTLPILYFSTQIQEWLGFEAIGFAGDRWVNPVLGTILFLYGGIVFLRGARHELADRRPGMMTLISLGISVAYLYSMAVAFGAPGMPFFWELATLIAIMLLGHWLEMASVQGASRALQHLASLVPQVAHRLGEGGVVDVPVSSLSVGDRILVRPGEQLAADGRVVDGNSSVNEAFLTGESRPVSKSLGDEVVAGSVNGEGALTVEVAHTGDETTLSQIQRLVEEAQASRSRFQNLADRAAGWLFYIALGVAAVTFVVWLFASQDLQQAITRTVTVLVIACPHALGLAIPLVTVNATALSARNGILVRNREAFERARDVRVVAFDKTGTLTKGEFGVSEVFVDETAILERRDAGSATDAAVTGTVTVTAEEALRIMAALETRSEHPLAAAVVAEADRRGVPAADVSDFEVVAGQGVRGVVNGRRYAVGRPEWTAERGLDLSPALRRGLEQGEARGESVIALMDDERVLALVALADKVRQGAKDAVRALKNLGVESVMITGDAEAVASTVAAELGIERYYARVLPQDKAAKVAELKRGGPTAFVGDGINDAPALLEADVGIAIGAGTDVAIESADLVLIEDDPLDVVAALKLSRATYGKMIQNLWWAAGYNIVALPLAAGVLAWAGILLSPAVGAVLMTISTIVVAVNATLLRRVNLAP
ncbi:MAG TPA: heavy metal translocating P-type ATPase [Trueperaceae bacterium]|nr:heavy metal translocating P-type ATPase [Trueperaceae bacterium]